MTCGTGSSNFSLQLHYIHDLFHGAHNFEENQRRAADAPVDRMVHVKQAVPACSAASHFPSLG